MPELELKRLDPTAARALLADHAPDLPRTYATGCWPGQTATRWPCSNCPQPLTVTLGPCRCRIAFRTPTSGDVGF
ncbi:hypothetical protein [Nonomuraea sp. B5E05]|uniref:hypothetical protein n=1 Tax=Nonomuraea sp. B5E05 TaxID=3153569 RepID=UPI00326140D0